jgi:serine/threonine-protein kinase
MNSPEAPKCTRRRSGPASSAPGARRRIISGSPPIQEQDLNGPQARLTTALADRYRIERELGQGGMATVYLAQDVRHDRLVALKVLRAELAAVIGASRFLAEIKTTANLQHPHILPLHDSGEVDGTVFYVMPYVDGESLRDRLNREKQLPVEEALRITVEVAGALEYAHQHKVIHRDIKPENILLQGGHALVADFGIALAAARSDGGTRMTETGMSLGTPHYMSPEQAMGEREITAKSDVYALGCVLYEMLTGEPPFTGPTAQAIVARVMMEEPRSLTLQRRSVPPHVEAAVVTALAKLPADRFATAAQFSAALGNTGYVTTATTRSTAAVPARRARVPALVPWALFGVTLAGLAALLLRPKPVQPLPPVTRFSFAFDGVGRIGDGTGSPIAVSPDGSRIVFIGRDAAQQTALFMRSFDREEPVQIAGTVNAAQPFFSPDGTTLGFAQDGALRKVAMAGGAVVTICDCGSNSGSWGADEYIYYTANGALFRVRAAGGQPETVAVPDTAKQEALRWADALPDGSGVLVTLVRSSSPSLAFVSLPDGRLHELGQGGMNPRWVEGDYLVFLQTDGTLFAAPFDRKGPRIGTLVPIAEQVRAGPAFPAKLGLSRNGVLAYLGGQAQSRELVLVTPDGRETIFPGPDRFFLRQRFSPDGRRLAVQIVELSARISSDIWIAELATGNLTRVTFDSTSSDPAWTPDGRHLVYKGLGGTLFRIATDGSGVAESLLARPNTSTQEIAVSSDGKLLVFRDSDGRTRRDVWVATLDTPRTLRPLLKTPFEERGIALSPDGRWLAYTSNESGTNEIFVRRLEEGSGRWKASRGEAREPRWGPDGRELFYRVGDSLMSATATLSAEPSFAAPRPVLVGRFSSDQHNPTWDISPDGKQFVFTRNKGETDSPRMTVLLNWLDRLRTQAAAR